MCTGITRLSLLQAAWRDCQDQMIQESYHAKLLTELITKPSFIFTCIADEIKAM